MEKKDKELLLKDLCARLPYGVKASTKISPIIIVSGIYEDTIKDETEDSYDVSFIKPYLRPMSSMTEEEKEELKNICTMYDCDMGSDYEGFGIKILNTSRYGTEFVTDYAAIDWFNKKMFDYRGLIPMGLALKAKEGMYNLSD